jgi:hypothetical protein
MILCLIIGQMRQEILKFGIFLIDSFLEEISIFVVIDDLV